MDEAAGAYGVGNGAGKNDDVAVECILPNDADGWAHGEDNGVPASFHEPQVL